jgi:ankyrin repeat protein
MQPFLATLGRDSGVNGHGKEGSAGRGILYRLACLFLKRGADLRAQDSEGRDPLTIAMETANADIVTL